MKTDLVIAPHNDDEALWCSFTIQRVKPIVLIVYDSYVQVDRGYKECTAEVRRNETMMAMWELLGTKQALLGSVRFCGLKDNEIYSKSLVANTIEKVIDDLDIGTVYFPAHEESGHDQHNLVSVASESLFAPIQKPIVKYLTYRRGATDKSKYGRKVAEPNGEAVIRKLKALACYKTQILNNMLGCRPHFMRDLYEYYE